ncbi:RHS repeat-associated core domain-containing protein [Vibrio quintilis]|uniref:Putative deoxyribonuclease RhsC n=1 Tax=Vibrio quintilis TaxID=1117707 RepID=A0A1M7YSW9_9VIBR|nr:RHS repeat-associated core domain-containing protein [Vibrio quintilis]SHO55717.1 Putative deoxyribonuclease RhsC [Vibrio quintilis]
MAEITQSDMEQELYQHIEAQLKAFPGLLNEYRKTSDTLIGKHLFSMDKQLIAKGKKENKETVEKDDDDYQVKVTCPQSGEIEIESVYQSIYHVPLGGLDVKAKAGWLGEVKTETLDKEGKATFKGLKAGEVYTVYIDQNPTEADVNAMLANYDQLDTDLLTWLRDQWEACKAKRLSDSEKSTLDKVISFFKQVLKGLWGSIKSIWSNITEIYDLISDPKKALKGMADGGAAILNAIKKTPEMLEQGLLFASDEAALYLILNAVGVYLAMLPLKFSVPDLIDDLGELAGSVIGDIVMGILGGIALSFVATPAAGVAYTAYRAARSAGKKIKRIVDAIIDVVKDFFKMIKKLLKKLCARMKKFVGGVSNSTKKSIVNGKIEYKARKTKHSNVETSPDYDVKNKPSEIKNQKKAASKEKTVCDKDPVSMATGEELLTITDGHLPGLLPFEWTRLYRTSACEDNHGLGFGWTHSLAHALTVEGDEIIWNDDESKLTRFPRPTRQKPAIVNRLAEAGAFLADNGEIVIISDSRFYYFRLSGDSGQLNRIEDQYGHQLHIGYLDSRPVRVYTDTNLKFELVYELGLIKQVDLYVYLREKDEWQFVQTQVTYDYNDQAQLISATNANGETERYTYDDQHVILSRQLAGGATFSWEWEREGKHVRAIRQYSNIESIDTRYEWDDESHTVTLTNSNGTQQVYQHDDNALLIKEVDASGGEYLKAYDDDGNLVEETDAVGNVTRYEYNAQGEMEAQIAPNGLVTQFTYNSQSDVVHIVQAEAEWHYKHDKWGHVTEQTDPLGHVTRYRYNEHGLIEQINGPDGSEHRLMWNMNGHLVSEVTPQGEEIRYRYDVLGRLRYRQDSRGVTEMNYDSVGRLVRLVMPGGKVSQYEYNAYGKVTRQTDPLGRVTEYEYQWPLHLVTRKINPDGSSVQYQYNNRFNFVSDIINERGERYQIEYAPTGHVQREVTFDGRTFSYEYDAHTQLTAKTETGADGTELATQYAYDSLGNLTHKILPDGREVSYQYDLAGRLKLVDDGRWPLAFDYDLMGQITEEHQGWASFGYRYDAAGQLSKMILPDGQIVEHQFQHGQVQQVSLNGECLTQHQYQPDGLEVSRRQGALTSRYLYDESGRLLEHRAHQASQQRLFRRYQYSQSGSLSRVEDAQRGIQEYQYDPLERLTSVRGVLDETFTHDPAGNLLSDRQANVEGNQLLFQGDRHFSYDEFGNLTQEARGKEGRLVSGYQYDCEHRLTQVTRPDGTQASYTYDAFGRRVKKQVTSPQGDTSVTEFLWQGDKLLSEISDNDYRTYLYEYETFRPLAVVCGEGPQAAQAYFYHLDQIGTPLEMTDSGGEVVWSVDYHAYGNVARQRVAQISSPLRFQGQYYDEETGLHYNRHRYYSPDTGRFITPDPIRLAGGLNNYQYVVNPTGWVDPLGLVQGTGNCSDNKKQLVTGELEVDEYGELSPGVVGDNLTPHHMPSNKYVREKLGGKTEEGISMMMEQISPGKGGRHRKTRTYGGKGRKSELMKETPRNALARDIFDVRSIYLEDKLYGEKVRNSLKLVIAKNKKKWPGVFDKKKAGSD